MSDRPNILFINTDQHSWNAISAYGNTWLNTPSIDRLHEHGVSFMRSYCSDPVCAPARASWVTGLYTSECGVPFNGGRLHDDIPDLGQLLNAAGYNAYHCGKWHVDGRTPAKGFKILWYGQRRVPAGGAEFYDPVSTHAAIDFLAHYDEEMPFYLQVGFVNPHDICEYGHNFVGKAIPGPAQQGFVSEQELPPLPENFDYDERETVLQIVSRRCANPFFHGDIRDAIRDWGELEWRFFLWNYYRFIEKVDAEIGLVLNALEGSRHRDGTLIIFSVDHGEAAGCHQMFQKFTLYEESIHVPFIVSSFGARFGLDKGSFDREHFISGVDFLPTVCDYAGVELPERVSGASIRPLLEGELQENGWRAFAYVESNYWGRALVGDQFKYVCEYVPKPNEDFVPPRPGSAETGREQLFDLQADPGETANLAGDADFAEVLSECREQLQAFESTLCERQMHPHAQQGITNRGKRLREYWEALV